MLFRFSLYGFLKNQRYFEPFLVLIFLDKGLSFAEIGILISFRELFRNIMEIPSGSFADLYGRKFSLILSLSAYILSFIIFSFSNIYWHFFPAMLLYAFGDAFRTGTHKAIIFTWLRKNDKLNEKTRVYGYTRSWSKIGSAVSIFLATIMLLVKPDYDILFLVAVIPYIFGLINIASYPSYLDSSGKAKFGFKIIYSHFINTLVKSFKTKQLRSLLSETMSYEGLFAAYKDYLQPIIHNFVLAIPILLYMDEKSRSSIFIGIVYFILYLISALASRRSHKLIEKFGSEEKGTKILWKITSISYLILIPILFFEYYFIGIVLFIFLNLLQNYWRPMQVSRFDSFSDEKEGAAILSIESQAKSLTTMLLAPILGLLIDLSIKLNIGGDFWIATSLAFLITSYFAFRKQYSS